MQYLVERYDTDYKISYPKGTREWYEMNNWLFFQNAGLGPMQGQASKYSKGAYSVSELSPVTQPKTEDPIFRRREKLVKVCVRD